MSRPAVTVLSLLAGLCFLATSPAKAQEYGSPFELQEPTYFVTTDQKLELLEAGSYLLEHENLGLRISSVDGGGLMNVRAEVMFHEQILAGPVALSVKGSGEFHDVHTLALLMPAGEGLVTVGSYSGVMPRGLWKKIKKTAKKTTKSATKVVGGATKVVSDVAKDVGKTATDVASDVGNAAVDVAKDVGVDDAIDAVGDAAKDVGDFVEDAAGDVGDFVVDTVDDAAKLTREAAEDAFEAVAPIAQDAINEAENLASEADRLRQEAYLVVSDPKRMEELLKEAGRLAEAAAAETVKALEVAWDAAVDATMWAIEQAQALLQELICKSMVYLAQGMDLMNKLTGPALAAVQEVTAPMTSVVESGLMTVMEKTGADSFRQKIQLIVDEGIDQLPPEANRGLTMALEILSNGERFRELSSFVMSPAVCELSGHEYENRVAEILGFRAEVDQGIRTRGEAPTEIARSTPRLRPIFLPRTRGEDAATDQTWRPTTRDGLSIRGATVCSQTFTAEKSGLLDTVALRVNRKAWTNSDLRLDVRTVDESGQPSGGDAASLFTTFIAPDHIPIVPSEELIEVDLSTAGIVMQSGQCLALTLSNAGATPYVWWRQEGYAGGKGYVTDEGSWTEGRADFVFETAMSADVSGAAARAAVVTRGQRRDGESPVYFTIGGQFTLNWLSKAMSLPPQVTLYSGLGVRLPDPALLISPGVQIFLPNPKKVEQFREGVGQLGVYWRKPSTSAFIALPGISWNMDELRRKAERGPGSTYGEGAELQVMNTKDLSPKSPVRNPGSLKKAENSDPVLPGSALRKPGASKDVNISGEFPPDSPLRKPDAFKDANIPSEETIVEGLVAKRGADDDSESFRQTVASAEIHEKSNAMGRSVTVDFIWDPIALLDSTPDNLMDLLVGVVVSVGLSQADTPGTPVDVTVSAGGTIQVGGN